MLHVALRASRDATIQSNGKNVVPDVWKVLDKIQEFSERVRNGSWVNLCALLFGFNTLCIPNTLQVLVGWSHRKTSEGCCCYWYWWQLLGASVCAHCTSNRLKKYFFLLYIFIIVVLLVEPSLNS